MYCARLNDQGLITVDIPQPQTLSGCPLVIFTLNDYPKSADFDSSIFAEFFFTTFFFVIGVYLLALKIGVIRKVMT